jgi:(R,R)-butanediol dehydrogenase / meso-butanediol dehydrogenase / diacetyl reductase
MHGTVFHGEREIELAEFPDLRPAGFEVIVEIKASGICGSDLRAFRSLG